MFITKTQSRYLYLFFPKGIDKGSLTTDSPDGRWGMLPLANQRATITLIFGSRTSENAMLVKNEKALKAINWFNTTGKWISVTLFLQGVMSVIFGLVSWAALKFAPSFWDWGVVVTQSIAFVLGVMSVGDLFYRRTSLHHKNPIIYVWFHTDFTGKWFYVRDGRLNTFIVRTLEFMWILCLGLKYNAIALAVVGVLYGAAKLEKSIKWDIHVFYGFGGLVGLALTIYLVNKMVKFFQFCKQMLAINKIIKDSESGSWMYSNNRDEIIKSWKSGYDRMKRFEASFLPEMKTDLATKVHGTAKQVLAASFQIKPPGEYASRETLSRVSVELNKLGRDLMADKQAADAHLFRVREKHEESKKKPVDTAA